MVRKFTCSNCLSMQYDLLKGMFFDTKEENDDCVLCTSKVMDDFLLNMQKIIKLLIVILKNNYYNLINQGGKYGKNNN